jgi:hypothetical protein
MAAHRFAADESTIADRVPPARSARRACDA